METRKRQIPEDGEASLPKKRALIDVRDSPTPHPNGTVVGSEEVKDDNLERFRKEAIYRKMKHYSREFERSQARIAELERWKRTCEAGLAALEACWAQLVDTARSLLHPVDAPVDVKANDLFELSTHISDSETALSQALEGKMEATKGLLVALIQRGVGSAALQDKGFQKGKQMQAECNALRSEMAILRSRLESAENERDRYHSELVTAEKRNDRLQSSTVREMNSVGTPQAPPSAESEKMESVQIPVPSIPTTSSPHSGQQTEQLNRSQRDNSEWQAIAALREQKILELENEMGVLNDRIMRYQLEYHSPSDSTIMDSTYYKALQERHSVLEASCAKTDEELNRLREQVVELQATRIKFEEEFAAEQGKAVQELKIMLAKRDTENARLREQRDQQLSELTERKQKDSVKLASLQELKTLNESSAERLVVFQSELMRLRTQLAASAGNKDLLLFFTHNQDIDADYVEGLESRLRNAESKVAAFEKVISDMESSNDDAARHVRLAAEAREQLAQATSRIEAYTSMFGDISSVPADAKAREEELQKLRLQIEQNAQASAALETELDKLSAAWETLERQVKNKVFDLVAMEDRVSKVTHEKAKFENKFYSAMRDKEASEIERKNIARNLEKSTKAYENVIASEKNLNQQVVNLVKEVGLLNAIKDKQASKIATLETNVKQWESHVAYEKSRVEQSSKLLQESQRSLDKRKSEVRRLEEDLLKSKKEVEKQVQKAKTIASTAVPTTGNSRELELQNEVDKCMSILKCSTCRMRMRNTVITKCMHSFCKECVDARISTRQRKCPACNLPFAQSDVAQVYFQ